MVSRMTTQGIFGVILEMRHVIESLCVMNDAVNKRKKKCIFLLVSVPNNTVEID